VTAGQGAAADPIVARIVARERWIIGGALAFIAALAWIWLWRAGAAMQADAAMAGMDMPGMDMGPPPGSSAYFASAFVMWLLMMTAMMLPSAAPMILTYARLARGVTAQGGALAPTSIFASVYLAVWGAFSLAAAAAQTAFVQFGAVSAMNLTVGNQRIGGVLLIAAGVYQATPLKRTCLAACRSPLWFLKGYWRPGWAGAMRLGLAHGIYCMGCCWLLMALLFVFGVMNLIWVAALALIVFAEKVFAIGPRVAAGVGAAAAIAGLAMTIGIHIPL
jgi:predicted metal-binding membrane protein